MAPARTITLAVAGQVSGVVMTSSPSPSPMPSARSARYIAAVQEETASASGRLGIERELALQLARERPGRQPARLERAQDVRALLVAQRGRREVEAPLAAHGPAAGDGGEIERDGHGAQDRRREPGGDAGYRDAGSRKTISLRPQVTTPTSRPNAMGCRERGPAERALRDQLARGRGVHAQAPRAGDDDHRVVGHRRHCAQLTAEALRPGAPQPALLRHGQRVQPGRLAGVALRAS